MNRINPINKNSDIIDEKGVILITTHEKGLGLLSRYLEQTDKEYGDSREQLKHNIYKLNVLIIKQTL